MPVRTRAQANRILDEEFAVLRNISIDRDSTADFVQVQITPSETGQGTHIRWIYATPPPEYVSPNVPTTQSGSDESPSIHTPELQKGELSKRYVVETPEPTTPTTPAAPNRLRRNYTKAAVTDAGERLYVWRRPGEDIETAIRRTVEMYYLEAAQRDAENRQRIRNFVQAHPIPLSENDTELFVREDSVWDNDPFQ